jgi:hypothetical protein
MQYSQWRENAAPRHRQSIWRRSWAVTQRRREPGLRRCRGRDDLSGGAVTGDILLAMQSALTVADILVGCTPAARVPVRGRSDHRQRPRSHVTGMKARYERGGDAVYALSVESYGRMRACGTAAEHPG